MGGKGSGGHPNSWNRKIGHENPYSKVPENNDAGISFTMELMNLPTFDLGDADALQQRILDYLSMCRRYETKPLISGLCLAIGSNREEVMNWTKGQRNRLAERLSPESGRVLQKSLESLEVLWEFSFQNDGYRNPVTGIFVAKNNFGYKDTTESVVRHERTEQGPTRAQLEAKYQAAIPADDVVIELPPDPKPKGGRKRLSQGDSGE